MEVKRAIATRLSIRQYGDVSIPTEHMDLLLKALRLAPSAGNRQNREFVFVGDRDLKKRLVTACFDQPFVGECTYFIAALADPRDKWYQVDVAIALTNFTLQATELGYGTCWIGDFDERQVKGLLGGPEGREVVVCLTFGLPKGKPLPKERKRIETFVHLNRYGCPWESISPSS